MKKHKVKIISYCIMNNHTHILVYVDKIESLSKFMKGINTTYAMYYNKKYKKEVVDTIKQEFPEINKETMDEVLNCVLW